MPLWSVFLSALRGHLARHLKEVHVASSERIEEPTVASEDQRRRRRRGRIIARRTTSGGFFSGLILGLGAAAFTNSVGTETVRYPRDGLKSDWFAIGNDLRSAMRQAHGEEE